jgi:hypothetical protein
MKIRQSTAWIYTAVAILGPFLTLSRHHSSRVTLPTAPILEIRTKATTKNISASVCRLRKPGKKVGVSSKSQGQYILKILAKKLNPSPISTIF